MGLLQNEQVQKELQLTEEQKQKLQGLGREMRDNRGAMQAKVAEILQPSQVERLKQIRLQVGGPMAVLQPDVAKDIELTDEQRGKIKAIMEQGRAKAFGDLSPEQRREKMQQVRKEHAAKVLEVLTPQQREKLDTLKGPKFDLDMSKVRKPGQGAGRRADGPKPPQ
jgi:Spy/CpxP family protein refolding chaperone